MGYPALETNDGYGMLAGSWLSSADHGYQLSAAAYLKRNTAVLYLINIRPDIYTGGHNDGGGTFTAAQAKAIDKKIDDGVARKGRFLSHRGTGAPSNCLDGDDGDYLLNQTQSSCMGEYILE